MRVINGIYSGAESATPRQSEDYYATDPKAIDCLFAHEKFTNVWECATGGGHLSNRLRDYGVLLKQSDIVTNPPFKLAKEFINEGNKAAFYLRLSFLEGVARKPRLRIRTVKDGD